MKLQYIIQIAGEDDYPFAGPKPTAEARVRVELPSTHDTHAALSAKLQVLLAVRCGLMMQVLRVAEAKAKRFTLDFEYVEHPLKTSSRLHEASFACGLSRALSEYCRELTERGVRQQLRMQDMGVTELGEIKIYPGVKFEVLGAEERENLEEEYRIMVASFMETHLHYRDTLLSPSELTRSSRISQRLTELEDRLNRMRRGGHGKEKEERQRQGMFLDLSAVQRPRQNTVAIGLTSSSVIHQRSDAKPHKLSFADSCSHLDESSSKESSSLTQRVTSALQKTEVALRVCERYSRRRHRRHS